VTIQPTLAKVLILAKSSPPPGFSFEIQIRILPNLRKAELEGPNLGEV
jgi:hypothetical protein